jgi:hypothetical protein
MKDGSMNQAFAGGRSTACATSDLEISTIRAASRRLIPFLVLAYFLA